MERDNTEIITIDEMCEILKIGKNTAYRLLSSQAVPAFRIGRYWKIPKQALEQFIRTSTENKFFKK